MGETKKKLLIFSACIIVVGLILALVGFSMGGKFTISKQDSGFKILDNTNMIEKNEELSQFNSIEVDSKVGKIDIIKSNRYEIEVKYSKDEGDVNYSIEDGKLVVKQDKLQNSMFGNINFCIGSNFQESYIKIYVPGNVDLTNLNVKANSGDFTMSDINVNEIYINCNYGDVISRNIVTNNLTLELNNGDIDLENIKSNNNAILKNSYGDIKIRNSEFNILSNNMNNGNLEMGNVKVENNTINNEYGKITSNNLISNGLKVKSNNGDIDLDGEFKGTTSLSSHYGDINFRTNISKDLYNYSASCNYGDINIDGDKFEKKVQNKGNNNTQNTIDVTSNNGDINMDFK
ncbi:hypothetical protein UT300005_09800 [Clostridium sp. CTA-5]